MTTAAFEASFWGAVDEVADAYEAVPFYGPHLDAAGLRPEEIRSPEDFRRIPPTSKADYRRHFPAGVLAAGSSLQDPFLFRSRSSGTTGERLITVAHSYALAERMTATTRVNPRVLEVFEAARQQRVCRYAAPNCSDVECATPFTTPASRTLDDGTLVLPVAHDLLATPESMVEQAVAEMADYRPHWLYTDPMHLAFLARSLRGQEVVPPETGAIVLTYNLVTQCARAQVEDFFGPDAVVVEVVSMSELGWMGMECPDGFVHLNTDCFYLELLTDDDRPAEPGELAELYVTSIGDQLCPHLRYRTGDVYTLLDGDCPCGDATPRVRFEGRGRDVPTRGGQVVLTPRQLDDLVGAPPWLDLYKLRQSGPDSDLFVFRYLPRPGAEDLEGDAGGVADLTERLTERLGDGTSLDIRAVDYIESERSGKFLPCVAEAE